MKVVKLNLQNGKFLEVVVDSDEAHGQLTDLLNWYSAGREALLEEINRLKRGGGPDIDKLMELDAIWG